MKTALSDKLVNTQSSDASDLDPMNKPKSELEIKAGDVPLSEIQTPDQGIISTQTTSRKETKGLMYSASFMPKAAQIQSEDYVALPEDADTLLDSFFVPLGISRDSFSVAQQQNLHQLFQREIGQCNWLRWCWVDSLLENLLQGWLLSPVDLKSEEIKQPGCARLKPIGRSLPLKKKNGLRKAYFARGLVKGLEFGLFFPVHSFIYAMLAYRFVKLFQSGDTGFDEFRGIFTGSDKKGIDSLVQVLSKIDSRWLKLILAVPLIMSALSSLWGIRRASALPTQEITSSRDVISDYLAMPSIWQDVLGELGLGIVSLIQKLEQYLRWDGRLSRQDQKQIFALIRDVAIKGKRVPQLTALQSLAKIAHGTGSKDFFRLKEQGYSAKKLQQRLMFKAEAFNELQMLTGPNPTSSASIFARVYAHYLLWWLGHSTSIWRQRLPYALMKGIKLALELYFINGIINSILEAIRCPDRPGFELGFGYPEWADELTTDCFLVLMDQFRSLNQSDSVDELVAQISVFNLADLDSLELWYKNLTGSEMVKILMAVTNEAAPLTTLNVYDYFSDTDMEAFASYLKISPIQIIRLGCLAENLPGGEGLTNQGLQYLINVLPDTQLTFLQICFPYVDNIGIINLAEKLNSTQIDRFYLGSANIDDTAGQILAQALATIPLKRVALVGSQIGDDTVLALAAVVQHSLVLTELWVQGGFVTDRGAQYFGQIILNSSLDTVALWGSHITDEGVISLTNNITNLPTLTEGLAIGSQSGEEGLIALAQQLKETDFWFFELKGYGNSFGVNSMQAIAEALPYTQITEFFLIDYQFNNETLAQLVGGLVSSSITSLNFNYDQFVDSIALLSPGVKQLEVLTFQSCDLNDDDMILLAQYLPGSAIQGLYLYDNEIGDAGVLALAKVLSQTNITTLDLGNNNITNTGAETLANIYSFTSLETLYLYGNNVSSGLLSQIENFQWQVYCQNQLCHANTHYNQYTTTALNKRSVRAFSTPLLSAALPSTSSVGAYGNQFIPLTFFMLIVTLLIARFNMREKEDSVRDSKPQGFKQGSLKKNTAQFFRTPDSVHESRSGCLTRMRTRLGF